MSEPDQTSPETSPGEEQEHEFPKDVLKYCPTYRVYTREEVAAHNTKEDIWIIIENKVYDITTWVDRHPGGYRVLLTQAGEDVTNPFTVFHPKQVFGRLKPFIVGELPPEQIKVADEFSQELYTLREKFRENGMFETDYTYIKATAVELVVLLAVSGYLAYSSESWIAHLIGACALGFYFQQIAFIGHDLGHTGVTGKWAVDYWWGSLLMLPGGLSVSWWKINHNTHHVVCNSVENDPDIQHLPFVCIDGEIIDKPYWSMYYDKWFSFDAAAKFLLSYQHLLFPVVFFFSRFNLYVHGLKTLLLEPGIRNRTLELVGWVGYVAWVIGLCTLTGSWSHGIFFFLVSHGVGGLLLSLQIGMSHWSMPVIHDNPKHENWFAHQLATSLDVDCYPWLDFFHGGLQFQVAHHLFPRVPRCHLREAREELRKVCKKHGITYHSCSFPEALRRMWVKWAEVAERAAYQPVHSTVKP